MVHVLLLKLEANFQTEDDLCEDASAEVYNSVLGNKKIKKQEIPLPLSL